MIFRDLPTFTVKRSEWLRGKGGQVSKLLSDGKMCCLGFYAKAQGFMDEDMEEVASPADLVSRTACKFESQLLGSVAAINSIHGCDLMGINDDDLISDEEREEQLKKKFASMGIEVEFID
jgi:hypothetical protein